MKAKVEINQSEKNIRKLDNSVQQLGKSSKKTAGELERASGSFEAGTKNMAEVSAQSGGGVPTQAGSSGSKSAGSGMSMEMQQFGAGALDTAINNPNALGEQIGGTAGAALGTSIGGPIGGVIGKEIGSQIGGTVQGMFGGDGPSRSDMIAEGFDNLYSSMSAFDQMLKETTKTTEDHVQDYKDLSSQIQGKKDDVDAIREAGSKDSYHKSSGTRKKDKKEQLEKRDNARQSKINDRNEERLALEQEREELRQKVLLYGQQLEKQLEDFDQSQADRQLAIKEQYMSSAQLKEQYADKTQSKKEVEAKISELGDSNEDKVEKVLLEEELLKLKREELAEQNKYLAAKSKELQVTLQSWKQIQAGFDQLKQKADQWMQQQTRKGWGSADWIEELRNLEAEAQGLNPADEKQAQELLKIQNKQFDALQQIERSQQQELAETKKLVKTLETAKGQVDGVKERLLYGQMGHGGGMEFYDKQYAQLKAATQQGTTEEQSLAAQKFAQYVDQYLGQARKQYKSGKRYQSIEGQVLTDLDQLSLNLGSQMNHLQAGGSFDVMSYLASQDTGFLERLGLNADAAKSQVQLTSEQLAVLGSDDPEAVLELYRKSQEGGYAQGGIARGSRDGHWELLHGTEAVIPLEKGFVPLVIEGGKNQNDRVDRLMEQNNRLLGELIDVERSRKGNSSVVVLDSNGLEQRIIRNLAEGSRRGVHHLGVAHA